MCLLARCHLAYPGSVRLLRGPNGGLGQESSFIWNLPYITPGVAEGWIVKARPPSRLDSIAMGDIEWKGVMVLPVPEGAILRFAP